MTENEVRVDLISDTQTRPTPEMRRAMAYAPVGDEQRGDDPSTNRLCAMVAALLGKDAAVFLPSGTMCNHISILVHCRPGDEILADQVSHIITSESAGAAVLAGTMIRPLNGRRGIFSGEQVAAAVRPNKRNAPRTRLVAIEQPVNRGGGVVWPLTGIEEVAKVARRLGLVMHMDGARLMNAVITSGVSAEQFATPFDSVWLDLSKSLGCPVGGVLAGTADFIEQAWRWKQRLGGAMRQSGILAAAGIYALEHHIERLADDHTHAQLFAARVAEITGIELDPPKIETNMVFFDVSGTGFTAAEVSARLSASGVRVGVESDTRMRAVTHLGVDRAGVEQAAAALALAVSGR